MPSMTVGSIDNWDKYLFASKKIFSERLLVEPEMFKQLKDFRLLKTIGTGTFGTVVAAMSIYDDNFYAIKIVEKEKIVKMNQVNQTLNEKQLLHAVNFPFIIRLEYYFKDNIYLYFVLPFINGGEMFSYLRKFGKFDEKISAFYASQVVLAFEYLHYLDIMYRDLKPENLIIDRYGYVKIIDLGFAKVVKLRTYTLCGTPDYLAPEVILSKGYTHSVDWWSLGVLIYEMCSGYPPFYSSDQMKTYELIVSGRYKMSPHFSDDVQSLISSLLQVDTTKRIGSLKGGANEIREHDWFRHIVWLDVLNRKAKAPFIPKVKGPGDTSNFDEYEDISLKQSSIDEFKDEFKDF